MYHEKDCETTTDSNKDNYSNGKFFQFDLFVFFCSVCGLALSYNWDSSVRSAEWLVGFILYRTGFDDSAKIIANA